MPIYGLLWQKLQPLPVVHVSASVALILALSHHPLEVDNSKGASRIEVNSVVFKSLIQERFKLSKFILGSVCVL